MREFTVVVYLGCLVAALALILAPMRPSWRVASVPELLDAVLAENAARITLLVFWWWLGWHFLVAQTVDPPLH